MINMKKKITERRNYIDDSNFTISLQILNKCKKNLRYKIQLSKIVPPNYLYVNKIFKSSKLFSVISKKKLASIQI